MDGLQFAVENFFVIKTWQENRATVILLTCMCLILTAPLYAVPPNPERPLEAQTCEVAQMRLAEAEVGSPLISAEAQVEILHAARANVQRLCDAGEVDGLLPEDAPPLLIQRSPDLPFQTHKAAPA